VVSAVVGIVVTAAVDVTVLPKLSVAVSVTLSGDVVLLVSESVARSAFTVASDALAIVRLWVPEPITSGPVADRLPVVSFSVTVTVP
jgi:hypothetical protein